jgi:histidinol phosphatase-like enzyme
VVCSHRPGSRCACRHPMPQLLVRAARMGPMDLTKAVVVSDRPHFLSAAAGLGCRTILVTDGSGPLPSSTHPAQVHDLVGAIEMVLGARPTPIVVVTPELQATS